MLKHVNIPGIIVLVVVLAVVQFGTALVLSPMAKSIVVEKINEGSGSKITIDSARLWPLTLSFSVSGLKVFDPEGKEKIVEVKSASARLSFLALLSKRVVISYVKASGTNIFLEKEPAGSFNVEELARTKEQATQEKKSSIFDRFKGKQDWFTRIYNVLKDRASAKAAEKKKQRLRNASKVKREVVELPEGRRVAFKTLRDEYLFEIRKLDVRDSGIRVKADRGGVEVKDARIVIKGLAMDPKKGAMFRSLALGGRLDKEGREAGSFRLDYSQALKGDKLITDIAARADDVDMTAVNFIYDDSLPVSVSQGRLDLSSDTSIVNGDIDSSNRLSLRDQKLEARSGVNLTLGAIPGPVLVQALNKADPLKLDFRITGTLENPRFSGFEKTLQEVIKPYIADIKEQGISAVKSFISDKLSGSSGTSSSTETTGTGDSAVDKVKALFQ